MRSLDDDRWNCLKGGYGTPFDPRPLLVRLKAGRDVDGVWSELWEELHHQGDVGEASYAAVPHLVQICREAGISGWNLYGIVLTIELARGTGKNPPVPEWLEGSYFAAIHELAHLGNAKIMACEEGDFAVRAILGILAIAKGLRTHAMVMVDYDEDELLELLDVENSA